MEERTRRQVLAASALGAVTLAGCVTDTEETDPNESAAEESEGSEGEVGEPEANESDETDPNSRTFMDTAVPFVQPPTAHDWWANDMALFVDARGAYQYEYAHIEGAVNSPADDGFPEDDPLDDVATDERIVTYCTCPYQMAGRRAATLIDDGYTEVYALDEGFQHWAESYPDATVVTENEPVQQAIVGDLGSAYAGTLVWIREPTTGQREVTAVADDGRFTMTLRFYDVSPETILELETAAFSVERTLSTLSTDPITPGIAQSA